MSDSGVRDEGGVGRLSLPPDPLLFELLYRPQLAHDLQEAFPWLLAADAAHVVMLAEQRILPRPHAAALLAANRDLAGRLALGEPTLPQPASHRGLYFLYERHLMERLGDEVGGAAHVARSRNDLNATVTRMRLRRTLLDLLDLGLELQEVALARAGEHAGTVMSGFTHFQPAQPATFGHYLAAVASEIGRSLALLAAAYPAVNRSPLGAGAGLGTSFAVDRERTAALLGFDAVIDNSLDAVASRDFVVHALSPLSLLGSVLTRLGLDLQLWSSRAYRFLGFPDDLVSTSSMMPQKRNAFVLENLRGQAARPAAALMAVLMGFKNTPFSNTVEVSSEATAPLWPAFEAGRTAVLLATHSLRRVEVDAARMRQFLAAEETTMTAVADHLVRAHGLSFRTAHEAVGRLLKRPLPAGGWSPGEVRAGLEGVLPAVAGRSLHLDEAGLAAALDLDLCLAGARFGGGPAPEAVRRQLGALREQRSALVEEGAGRRRLLAAAERRLAEAIGALVGGGAGGSGSGR